MNVGRYYDVVLQGLFRSIRTSENVKSLGLPPSEGRGREFEFLRVRQILNKSSGLIPLDLFGFGPGLFAEAGRKQQVSYAVRVV